ARGSRAPYEGWSLLRDQRRRIRLRTPVAVGRPPPIGRWWAVPAVVHDGGRGAVPHWHNALAAGNDAMATASVSCKGECTNSITGFQDGQLGFAHTTQTGLMDTGATAGIGCPPEQDGNCFPAEKVQFKAIGRSSA